MVDSYLFDETFMKELMKRVFLHLTLCTKQATYMSKLMTMNQMFMNCFGVDVRMLAGVLQGIMGVPLGK